MSAVKHLGVGLGFVGGYVDTVGFILLAGLFTAHVTGNFVLIGKELVLPSHGVLIRFLAFFAFIAAVALTHLGVSRQKNRGREVLRPALYAQIGMLVLFMAFGSLAEPIGATDTAAALLAGAAGAAAMGIQNAASRLMLSDIAPTAVMTGNVTQLVIDTVDFIRGQRDSAVRDRIDKFLWPVLAFILGAICGAYSCVVWQFWSLAAPIAILTLLATVHRR